MFVLPGNLRRCGGCHIRLQFGRAARGIGRVPAVAWIDTYGFMERAQMTSSRSSGRKAAAEMCIRDRHGIDREGAANVGAADMVAGRQQVACAHPHAADRRGHLDASLRHHPFLGRGVGQMRGVDAPAVAPIRGDIAEPAFGAGDKGGG